MKPIHVILCGSHAVTPKRGVAADVFAHVGPFLDSLAWTPDYGTTFTALIEALFICILERERNRKEKTNVDLEI